ncbi:thiamine pyrophosphate enzyme, central domain-containing protein [Trichoderma breve]|uniref:Thiamine pyrophosphate enzyme, central domain-containing protein n=1 Tax=Trichoderma breve TaxID=2034170 RepID=A0A9W9E3S4_9HYPO|nr:thiamine pyrophosphate enzyme, central domain-containing protein [Trichoderma breve]KAJ4857943.1 thiamine pyrophosphate enzyme, central domain-containing protein [Trichoderma breve]
MYSTSFAFFEAIWDAGVTHCFVNLGSDHPGMIEAMVQGQREAKGKFPRIITCPSEMVAMSMADGYARLTGKPQCVIVHVDVGTQALGVAVHNASSGHAPVLIFAGMSPFTQEGEMRGSRTEFIHWLQDVPDQKAILGQYCRYTAEIKTGVNIKQMVNRALQFSRTAPHGPVYLCAAREVMEAEIKPYSINQKHWDPVDLGGLSSRAASNIAESLANAKKPLIVTGYSGRNHSIPDSLVELADTVKALRVLDTAGSDMCFPGNHPAWLGVRQGADESIPEADVILVLDCDVPQILDYLKTGDSAKILASKDQTVAEETRHQSYSSKLQRIDDAAQPFSNGSFGTAYLSKVLRTVCPENTIWAVEAVTNTGFIHDNVRPTQPGSWINCGGGGLGWSGGGALGIKLATDAEGKGQFVCQVVGDGTYLFSIPGSVYWISKRYNIPILTIVLNNNGWNAPRKSYMLIHPDGVAAQATNEEMNISFSPSPDYAGIAAAAGAGDIHALKVTKASELESILRDAVAKVKAGKTAVVDCKVVPDC